MDIVVWLRSLGLGKYEAIFRENDIDETVLPSLTHENLKELGVTSFGHRVKLLDAIAALRNDAGAQASSPTIAPASPVAATTTHAPVTEAVGERRHITVMFCDLVGSTGISAGLDAEEWRDLVGAYLDAATAAVTEMGGHVAKKLGDGLMALFGYPVAQENDAERAARAALSIQLALAELNRKSGGGRRSGQRNLAPFVGREEEIAMLMRRWERAHQGDGQLVLIVGEPELGKTRLIEEFHARLRDIPHTWVEWSGSQLLQNTPLHPITEWGRMRFGSPDAPAERGLIDLESSLAQVKLDPAENAPLLAPLLDIPLPPERAPALAPEELRRRQLAALTNWIMAGARSQSVVLAFEDLHWADPTTIDVLRGVVERGALVPLFVLATTRPEFRPPWGTRSHHSTISLAPLDRQQVLHMVGDLAARHALRHDVVEDVWARTSGVPLFVEEVTRLLLERGEEGGTQAIPTTLQQSLMARLDRLGPAREVAQVGAVIGRGFSYALLRAIAGMQDGPLQSALEQLAESDLILVQGLPPDSDYRFKHALIQDAAYENLLKSRRTILHRRVAETLRDKFPVIAAGEPEVLSYHFTHAGLDEQAIEWGEKAGDQALHRSAYVEAIGHLDKAIGLTEGMPSTPSLRREQIRLQVALITPLIHVKGYAAPETKGATERARLLIEQAEALGEHPEDPLLLFTVLYGFAIANFVAFNGDTLRELASQFLALAEKQRAAVPIMIGHRLIGHSFVMTGSLVEGRAHYDQVIALYDPREHRTLTTRFGQDVLASILPFRALSLWANGYPEAAIADAGRGIKHSREIDHATFGSMPYVLCGEYAAAKTQSDEIVALAVEKGHRVQRGRNDEPRSATCLDRQGV